MPPSPPFHKMYKAEFNCLCTEYKHFYSHARWDATQVILPFTVPILHLHGCVFVPQMWQTPFFASTTIYTADPAAVLHHADQHLFSHCNWCRCSEHFRALMQRLYLNTRNTIRSTSRAHSFSRIAVHTEPGHSQHRISLAETIRRMSLCRSLAEGRNYGFSFSFEMLSIMLLLPSVQKIARRMMQGQIFIYCPFLKRHWCSWRRSFIQWRKRCFNGYNESDAVHTDSYLQNYSVTKTLSPPVTGNTVKDPFHSATVVLWTQQALSWTTPAQTSIHW